MGWLTSKHSHFSQYAQKRLRLTNFSHLSLFCALRGAYHPTPPSSWTSLTAFPLAGRAEQKMSFLLSLRVLLWFISQVLPYGVSFASLSCPLTNIYFLRALASDLLMCYTQITEIAWICTHKKRSKSFVFSLWTFFITNYVILKPYRVVAH